VGDHRETHKLRSPTLKQWLTRLFYGATGKAPNSDSTEQAIRVLESKACFDGPLRMVSLRVASADGKEYLDLGRPDWSVVEVDADGWRISGDVDVAFRRAAGVGALPIPMPNGSVNKLRRFLNLQSDEDFVLVVAWLCTALRGRGPYPLLVLLGEQGTGKTTFARILRAIVDPNAAPLRSLPREDRDLFIAARNGHVLAFDNISAIPNWISDTLCRLATGGGFAVRQLYSDDSETLFNEQRPCILNGIDEVVGRADLADRAVFVALEPIAEAQRKLESDLWAEFDAELPHILGGLLDLVATGIRELPNTVLDGLPRMADFARWAASCTSEAWGAGCFIAAYSANRQRAARAAAETDALAAAIRDFALATHARDGVTVVTLTPSNLLASLEGIADERDKVAKSWPATARALTTRLTRLSPVLRALGISLERTRAATARKVILTLDPELLTRSKSIEEPASPPSSASLPSSVDTAESDPDHVGPWSVRL
jgi:hypothetical protein